MVNIILNFSLYILDPGEEYFVLGRKQEEPFPSEASSSTGETGAEVRLRDGR